MFSLMHGVKLYSETDMVLQDAQRTEGVFEPDTFKVFDLWLEYASSFLDIGAYSGIYSIYAAKRGLKVSAFEPNPVVFKRLQDNILLNDVEVSAEPYALSNKKGTCDLFYRFGMTSAASLVGRGNSIKVSSITLNDLNMQPDIIKIDVENHELAVLAGGSNILSGKPRLIIETLTPQLQGEVKQYLKEYGYSEFDFLDSRNLICQ